MVGEIAYQKKVRRYNYDSRYLRQKDYDFLPFFPEYYPYSLFFFGMVIISQGSEV